MRTIHEVMKSIYTFIIPHRPYEVCFFWWEKGRRQRDTFSQTEFSELCEFVDKYGDDVIEDIFFDYRRAWNECPKTTVEISFCHVKESEETNEQADI